MSETTLLHLNGADLLAHATGALIWPAGGTLIVADLHFEKGSSYARGGSLLPPYDTRATLDRLESVVTEYQPQRIVCLGDSFHDGGGADRLSAEETRRLNALTGAYDWIWIAGNHDPAPASTLGGRIVPDCLPLGPLILRHRAAADTASGEVSGHYHPKASFVMRARRLTGRCFLADNRRIILPAFGAYAGGLDAGDPVFASLFPAGCAIHFIGRTRIATLSQAAINAEASPEHYR